MSRGRLTKGHSRSPSNEAVAASIEAIVQGAIARAAEDHREGERPAMLLASVYLGRALDEVRRRLGLRDQASYHDVMARKSSDN